MLVYDPTRPETRIAALAVTDALEHAAGRADPVPLAHETRVLRGSRYIDFLLPGLIGLNLMGSSMWGIGFNLVLARKRKLLRRYAVSEDGALHAEKYYRTVNEEFGTIRPAFRWRELTALARVTASEYGRPAAGSAEARALLKL